jgi:hypothetical protein
MRPGTQGHGMRDENPHNMAAVIALLLTDRAGDPLGSARSQSSC